MSLRVYYGPYHGIIAKCHLQNFKTSTKFTGPMLVHQHNCNSSTFEFIATRQQTTSQWKSNIVDFHIFMSSTTIEIIAFKGEKMVLVFFLRIIIAIMLKVIVSK